MRDLSPSIHHGTGGPELLLLAVVEWWPWLLTLAGVAALWAMGGWLLLRATRQPGGKKEK